MIYYEMQLRSEDFYKVIKKIDIYNLKTSSDYMQFTTTLSGFEKIKAMELQFELLNSTNPLKSIFLKKGLIIGLVLLILVIYVNTFRVTSIQFNHYYPINDEIQTMLEINYKKILFTDITNQDLSKVSYELRCKYPSYAYIEVYKKGSKLYVDISNDNYMAETKYKNIPCDIIATKSGVINNYLIYNGKSLIEQNKYVNEGDILVSGQLTETLLVSSKGYIFASVYDEYEMVIQKNMRYEEVSSKTSKSMSIDLIGREVFKEDNNKFLKSESKKVEVFNLFGLASISKYTNYEINDIIKEYTYQEALEEAYNQIEYDFKMQQIHSDEVILEKHLLLATETEEVFTFKILTLKNMQIGAIKEIN